MTSANQESASIDRIAEISKNIRQAIRNALPTPPEQFLTIMVPGKVVNFGDYAIDDASNAILPRKTELNQAILCDDMPTLSSIQMGPTGKSVARSYANAISKLVAAGTTVGVDDGKEKTVDQKRYEQGMKFLSTALLDRPGQQTLVELYTEKQSKYTQAVENKTKAFGAALQRAKDDPRNKSSSQVREAYDKWVDENARTYRAYVQAAYMDWVITGRKEEVEYWFSVVDQDSALAQEVMRWAVVQDVDGSCEYQKVKLEPSDWANKCLDKIKKKTNQTKTVEWYNWEISRLEKTLAMLQLVSKPPPADGDNEEAMKKELVDAKNALASAMSAYKEKQKEYQAIPSVKDKAVEKNSAKADFNKAKETLDKAQGAFDEVNVKGIANQMKSQNLKMFTDVLEGGSTLIQKEISRTEGIIEQYTADRKALIQAQGPDQNAIQDLADEFHIPKAAPDPAISIEQPDPFTPITVSISASNETNKSESSATSFSASASASWGLGSFSASVSHSEAHSKASKELATSDVKVSFECMRVDINRPWLRPELFYDDELIPADKVKISPGFSDLKHLMENSIAPAQDCGMFPMYPVAFIVACNVVLEISGSTSSLQTYMNDSSTSASVSVGYGCFSASGSGSHSSSDAGSTCKATASGCRIEIKSPQIIGWVSQLVPALPRLSVSKSALPAAQA